MGDSDGQQKESIFNLCQFKYMDFIIDFKTKKKNKEKTQKHSRHSMNDKQI